METPWNPSWSGSPCLNSKGFSDRWKREAWPFKSQALGSWAEGPRRLFQSLSPHCGVPQAWEVYTEIPESIPQGGGERHPRSPLPPLGAQQWLGGRGSGPRENGPGGTQWGRRVSGPAEAARGRGLSNTAQDTGARSWTAASELWGLPTGSSLLGSPRLRPLQPLRMLALEGATQNSLLPGTGPPVSQPQTKRPGGHSWGSEPRPHGKGCVCLRSTQKHPKTLTTLRP